ncbi:hypothetical protein [Parafrankia sp. BMG5.11]|uniref:hypothetical protein n=1 Tax=Parafrankia sp. BMG5.11 TaxID=222540 RepID=UPI00140509AB|nr:hypothetical protein [Parafrankia sp. BMG5.11]
MVSEHGGLERAHHPDILQIIQHRCMPGAGQCRCGGADGYQGVKAGYDGVQPTETTSRHQSPYHEPQTVWPGELPVDVHQVKSVDLDTSHPEGFLYLGKVALDSAALADGRGDK